MSSLMKRLLAASTVKHSAIMSESVMFNQRDVIPTDIPIINAAFSGSVNGGIHSGLILAAGPSKSYKTLLSLVCVKAYLNKYDDAIAIILDSEGGVTPEYLKQQGVDPARVLHVPIENLEELKFEMVKQLKEINRGDHVIFVIDSIGNTASVKEIEDAMNEKVVGDFTRAKSTKALFRMVTPSLITKDIPCIAICHTYEEIGAMYAKTIISGGTGLIYSSSTAFIIGKSQEKDGTDLIGWNFTLNAEKSRFVREKSKFTFTVTYENGINKYSGILDLAIDGKFVSNATKGWYQMIDQETGELLGSKVRRVDTENEAFLGTILKNPKFDEYVQSRFRLSAPVMSEEEIGLSDLDNED